MLPAQNKDYYVVSSGNWKIVGRLILMPVHDVLRGLDRCLDGYGALFRVMLGLAIGWWCYVPIHELLHAFGCWATGGEVTRLEIGAIYGGAGLAAVFPFVHSGSEYAGQLTGFDTFGNDAIYLATDFAPFVLTIFPGVWAMRAAAHSRAAFRFGLCLPVALAPFMSLTGDAYEIGSIIVTQLGPWAEIAETVRGDDVFRVIAERPEGAGWALGSGVVAATLLGVAWAWGTYLLAAGTAALLGRRATSV